MGIQNNKWKDYLRTILEEGGFVHATTVLKNETETETYIFKDKKLETSLKIGYLEDDLLIYLECKNPKFPGYTQYKTQDYFERYHFHSTETYGGPGLQFNEENRKGILEFLNSGIEGHEIQWFRGEEILKSTIWLNDIEFQESYDYTGRGFIKRLIGKKVEDWDGVEKRTLDLKELFGGLKNK